MADRKRSLKNARKGRTQIAQMFTALDNQQTHIQDVLGTPPAYLKRIRIYDVLRRVPHLNRDGAEKVLRDSRVWPLTAVGNLTLEDRRKIISHLPPRVKR